MADSTDPGASQAVGGNQVANQREIKFRAGNGEGMSKAPVKQYKWVKVRNNYILRIDDSHYISYNPDANMGNPMAIFNGMVGSESEDGEETALVDKTNPEHNFRILVGDWRDEYEKLVPLGFDACLDFYMEHRQENGGAWSTHERDRA